MKNNNDWWQRGLLLFGRLAVWIAAPVVIGSFAGQWLDQRFQTTPWLFLTTVGLAFVVSMFGLVTNAQREMKRVSRLPTVKKVDQV